MTFTQVLKVICCLLLGYVIVATIVIPPTSLADAVQQMLMIGSLVICATWPDRDRGRWRGGDDER